MKEQIQEIYRPMNEELFNNLETQYQALAKVKAESEQIEKQAIEEMTELLWHFPKALHLNCYNDCCEAVELLYNEGYRKQINAVWVERRCEFTDGSQMVEDYYCSNCFHEEGDNDKHFCPNCGAKMKGGG